MIHPNETGKLEESIIRLCEELTAYNTKLYCENYVPGHADLYSTLRLNAGQLRGYLSSLISTIENRCLNRDVKPGVDRTRQPEDAKGDEYDAQ